MQFKEKMSEYAMLVETSLKRFLPQIEGEQQTIAEAARYSLLDGGKRIRPVLCLAVGDLLDSHREDLLPQREDLHTSRKDLLPYGCAIEMIHAFSLIHDDLPCMDNDDYRRGRLTSHKVFGEGIAVLAGDALINRAYEIMLEDCAEHPRKGKIEAVLGIAAATGMCGMIGGQTMDLENEHRRISHETLMRMHRMKTGALIKAPVTASCLICQAPTLESHLLGDYAEAIGLAFQIKDDVLDATSDRETLGKTAGKDFAEEKSTYVSLFGLPKAEELLKTTTVDAFRHLDTLKEMGYDTVFLHGLTEFLLQRKN